MKRNTRRMHCLGASLLGLTGGFAFGQEIETTQVDGETVRVRIKAPQVELERINPDGTTTTEAASDENQRIIEFDVPMDTPSKLFRARVRLGDQEFGSDVRRIVEGGTVPNLDQIRPSSITMKGNLLTLQFPPEHTAVRNKEFFPQGFPLFLSEGPVTFKPGRAQGTFTAPLRDDVANRFQRELGAALNRLRNLGDGTVPVYADRQLTGHLQVPEPGQLGDSIDIFPFLNNRDIQPLACAGGPILGSAAAVDPQKSLMITDLSVVEDLDRTYDPFNPGSTYIDPGTGRPRKWTFGFLMEEMCNSSLTGLDPKVFTRRWIQHFENLQVINFDTVPDRAGAVEAEIIDKWEARNVLEGLDPLDLKNAPFRLTAIVNRVDLRSASGYAAGDAGECRFVFCAYDLDTGAHLPMTVIFEYGVPLSRCPQIKGWAQRWHQLGGLPFGPAYNTELEKLTDVVALANANPSKPNGSAINQLRSNNFIGPGDWTLREWQITGAGVSPNDLTAVTTKQTPAHSKLLTPDLANYINTYEADILAGSHTIPLSFPGATPFLSGKSRVPAVGTPSIPGFVGSFFWDTPGIANNDARHCLSLNTCNGCHGGEGAAHLPPAGSPSSSTPSFVHIAERNSGTESHLSRFLTGTGSSHVDPVSGVPRVFNDLHRRAADLDFAANMPCLMISLTPALATRSH